MRLGLTLAMTVAAASASWLARALPGGLVQAGV